MADVETTTAPKPAGAVPAPGKQAWQKAAEKVTETAKEAIEKVAEKASEGQKDLQVQVNAGLASLNSAIRNSMEAQRAALETAAKAGRIYHEGVQQLAKHAAEVGRTQFEDGVAHVRKVAAVRSFADAAELHSAYTRQVLSSALTATGALVEGYLKVASDAIAPVTASVREAAEKVKTVA